MGSRAGCNLPRVQARASGRRSPSPVCNDALMDNHQAELAEALAASSCMEEACVRPHHERWAAEVHATTWFQIDGMSDVIETTRGSRPGDPFGDFVHSFLMAKLLKHVEAVATAEGIITEFSFDG